MKDKDIVIFGAGQVGRMALTEYKDRTLFFVDNNQELQGTYIDGIEVKSMDNLSPEAEYAVVIASKHQEVMEKLLQQRGIFKYEFFLKESRAYYETEDLVFNPYEDNPQRDVTEEAYNDNMKRNPAIETVNYRVEQMQGKELLFDHVEIETINRCNGVCDFCPVSRQNDTREFKIMSRELFERIIGQLAEIEYDGKLALFSNNEPFLDEDIIDKHRYAREKLPNARMHLFTNGTLLTIDKFVEIMKYLDELIIDNYHQELKLIKPCKEIVEYCEKYPQLKKKVTIVLRKPKEVLSTRGGDSPNRKKRVRYADARCVLPYKQLIIRPDGKVSLCCNDPLGKNTLGDLNNDSIKDIWFGERFNVVRNCLYQGRQNWKHCEFCDVFALS